MNDSIVRKGTVVQQLFFYDGDKYFHYTGNAATSKKVTDDNWAMERKTASWHNLVPGRTYTFQITANVGPKGHCPAATVNKTMEIWISNDGGDKWQNVANLRSSDDAVASPRAEVPATTLKYPFPKDYCNNDKNDVIWGEPTTVTFKGTAGPDGVLRFRYNAWMQPQPPGQYPYPWGGHVNWGPAIMRVTHPRIVD
ncbi:hypothetical protein [Arthrobacter sp. UM1]|uniref:hypothetical protein n=1 Tax=Arthrobacter sp. UM1 TaxID=2766776 RepID=UPI001CF69FFA|nr:hypothetical protein [Arthrobacter sp. UM1]MCB4208500.1 hypothetical protein [Arthrobacter sp. UM1]